MPIYEFLCPHCNRIFSFLSRAGQGDRQPTCPRCGASDLTKQVSRFAFVRSAASPGKASGEPAGADGRGYGDTSGEGGPDPLDDPRIEREMMQLMQDAEHMDENDPRQIGRFMRRMSELSGEALDGEMEEAVRRLEAGEDPEKVEEDIGGLFGDDESGGGPFGMPSHDEGLYDMD
jgi:putative FmdB family regulatory protein